jgi:hypothetical protein
LPDPGLVVLHVFGGFLSGHTYYTAK